ncbi:hypothetical protein GGI19_003876 [Coemansia pectinata]|uniref:RING-type domain-containing protein n=1 Tax=Coemansia pectinata TaxID=1052879 RepID=A0A9W8GYT4_9FUNG|nr:hypothetical protein GGI19_003876 [Coemansia pectinata]
MVSFNALPFPASSSELPPAIEHALRELNGPLRDRHNAVYELAKPLERSQYPACPSCGSTFNLFRRKNNCGNCGQVVCSDCLDSKWYLPKYGLRTAVACCTMCDRNLHTSIKSKQDLESCSIRELRAYLQLYGLYRPSTMIEKSDLVAAIYNNSPVPQANEKVYRDSLPRPSGSVSSSRHQQQQHQQQHTRSRSNASDRTTNWDRMFSDIGSEIGRGMENIGQQLGEIFEPRSAPTPNEQHRYDSAATSNSQMPRHDSRTYSHAYSRAQRAQPSRSQPQFQPPRPRSAQNLGSQQTTNRPAPAPAPAPASAASGDVPNLKDLVRANANVGGLSIKTLKALLAKYHVDYSNIVEKQELVQRVERLVVNTKLEMGHEAAASTHSDSRAGGSGSTHDADDNLCRICWDATTNSVFLNCGHMCTCLECGEKIVQSDRRECPICREYITRIVHVFRA